jgi:hypothetical protein
MTGVCREEQKRLHRMTNDSGENMSVSGCGRVDVGGQVFCFDLKVSEVFF